jgi:hypothetical protein
MSGTMKPVVALAGALLLLLLSTEAYAQDPDKRGDSAPSLCERLAGAARAQCLRDERARAEPAQRRERFAGRCDALVGPEKELCLREGGTVEAGAARGATKPRVLK